MDVNHSIRLLQCSVDPDDESCFRVLVNREVKYLYIAPNTYSSEDMCFEPSLIAILPSLPPGNWNTGYISRNATDEQPRFTSVAKVRLPHIEHTWHPLRVDFSELRIGRRYRSHMYEAESAYFSEPVVIKFARFPWEIGYLDAETKAYQWLQGQRIGPKFLGHLTEGDRVIGFVMERITPSRHATPKDLVSCRKELRRLHRLHIMHGDLNKYNFLVRGEDATLIDLENARPCENHKELEAEMKGLERALMDSSGKGGQTIISNDVLQDEV